MSCMGFRLQQKLMTNPLLSHQSYACFDYTAEARITRFRYKIAPHLSCLHIKSDDKTKGNPFEFQAYFPIRLRPKLN